MQCFLEKYNAEIMNLTMWEILIYTYLTLASQLIFSFLKDKLEETQSWLSKNRLIKAIKL